MPGRHSRGVGARRLQFCVGLAKEIRARDAVLDGEIACLDDEGRAVFSDLMRRNGHPCFLAFDLAWLNGKDLRDLPLKAGPPIVPCRRPGSR
jgi:ATP-dependent DNA ligase